VTSCPRSADIIFPTSILRFSVVILGYLQEKIEIVEILLEEWVGDVNC